MSDATSFSAVRAGLNQPERGLFIAPVRHHSPACAWAVRQMIRELQPRQVLIEAPADFASHIGLLTHAETAPPVAIAALVAREGEERVAAYYPFCTHSPEYVAIREAHALGAAIRFIDLPAADKIAARPAPADDAPVALTDEHRFDSSDFVAALCRRTQCRNGFELWDHLFETRLGASDWRSLLGDVGAYCAGIRAATTPEQIEHEGDAAREAHMAACLVDALANDGPVVIVIGGFHAPALLEAVASGKRPKPGRERQASRSFLIRYSFAALDALNGYAAGLPQPAYYEFLWGRANEASGDSMWRQAGLDLASGFAAAMREAGHPIGLPQQVEMVRVAEGLASMRGRPGASRHDLLDAVRTALVKGEAGIREAWTERLIDYLRGTAIGNVPASAGSPPLVEDARAVARRNRIDVSDGARRRRRLDVRRNPAHLAASQYFHAMTLLDTGFAEREGGPDFVNNVLTDLLFEEWSYAWSPTVEGRLIELAARADRIDSACLCVLESRRERLREEGRGRDIAALSALLARGLLAGLGAGLAPFLARLGADIQQHADFAAVAEALRRLWYIARSRGPLGAPPELELGAVTAAAYARLVYLCDDLPNTPPGSAGERVTALRMVTEMLANDTEATLDRSLFDDALDRVAAANPPAELLGAVLAIAVQAGRRGADDLRNALAGQFAGSALDEEARVAMLRGMLGAAPQLIARSAGVIEAVDAYLAGLDEDAFLAVLPHLRLAFTALNPREIDELAERLASIHGGSAGSFAAVHHTFSAQDLERALAIEKQLRASIAIDGLETWLNPGGRT